MKSLGAFCDTTKSVHSYDINVLLSMGILYSMLSFTIGLERSLKLKFCCCFFTFAFLVHDITVVHTQLRNETEWQLVTKVFALYIRKHHAVIENIPRTPGRSLVKHCSCDFFFFAGNGRFTDVAATTDKD